MEPKRYEGTIVESHTPSTVTIQAATVYRADDPALALMKRKAEALDKLGGELEQSNITIREKNAQLADLQRQCAEHFTIRKELMAEVDRLKGFLEKGDSAGSGIHYVPYQVCPQCMGTGMVCTGTTFLPCDVCKGTKTIPMHNPFSELSTLKAENERLKDENATIHDNNLTLIDAHEKQLATLRSSNERLRKAIEKRWLVQTEDGDKCWWCGEDAEWDGNQTGQPDDKGVWICNHVPDCIVLTT